MAKVTEIAKAPPVERTRKLRVAAYCRVSNPTDEQYGSLDSQIKYYTDLIDGSPNWVNAGVYAESISGLSENKRTEFRGLMTKCRRRRVDLILTKSFSRFGRNTLEMLETFHELQELSIDVYFEVQGIRLLDQNDNQIIAMYCAFAQAESEWKSSNIKWGIEQGFRSGTSGYADFVCFGYKKNDKGELAIDEPDAKIVRKLFDLYIAGYSLGQLSDYLFEQGVRSSTGKERWSKETIKKLLHNEKYTGNVLLQKTYVDNLFSGEQLKNTGQKAKYLVKNHHPAIVDEEKFERAQLRFENGVNR